MRRIIAAIVKVRIPPVWLVAAAIVAAWDLPTQGLGSLVLFSGHGSRSSYAAQPADAPSADYGAMVEKYCVTCHNDRLKTGGLSLQNLDPAAAPTHAEVWEKVARKLRSGEMPPPSV